MRDTYLRDTRSHLNCRDCVADLNERTERAEKRRWRERKKGGSRAHRRALILLFTFSALAARAGLLSRLTDFIRMQIRGCARARASAGDSHNIRGTMATPRPGLCRLCSTPARLEKSRRRKNRRRMVIPVRVPFAVCTRGGKEIRAYPEAGNPRWNRGLFRARATLPPPFLLHPATFSILVAVMRRPVPVIDKENKGGRGRGLGKREMVFGYRTRRGGRGVANAGCDSRMELLFFLYIYVLYVGESHDAVTIA